ncbi:hypothetical protein MPER_05861 [Moniliophthora perniciosa FA553]|nr:hypothetical protein MPER_05861 [Moniliophthora perniciosa FA553]
MLTQIAPLAKAYGFALHLADAVYTESGRGYWGGCYWDSDEDDEDDIDAEELDMDEVDETFFYIRNVVALDGMPMTISGADLDDHERLCVNGEIKDRDCISDFDRNDRESGTLTHTWSSKALLITPKASPRVHFSIGAVSEFACTTLTKSFSEAPSARESKLVEALLEWLKTLIVGTTFSSFFVCSKRADLKRVLSLVGMEWPMSRLIKPSDLGSHSKKKGD